MLTCDHRATWVRQGPQRPMPPRPQRPRLPFWMCSQLACLRHAFAHQLKRWFPKDICSGSFEARRTDIDLVVDAAGYVFFSKDGSVGDRGHIRCAAYGCCQVAVIVPLARFRAVRRWRQAARACDRALQSQRTAGSRCQRNLAAVRRSRPARVNGESVRRVVAGLAETGEMPTGGSQAPSACQPALNTRVYI